MNISSLQEVKEELKELPPKQLLELCLQLAKYKKDNKEYLGYLLFQSRDRDVFIAEIKSEIDNRFLEIKELTNLYPIRKGLRTTLRIINKYCKYMGDKAVTAELLIYFCRQIKNSKIPIHKSARLENLFNTQTKRINSAISFLHEDLQTDYLKELEEIK
jgi:hypothetical protein